jgi:hypothetical protein
VAAGTGNSQIPIGAVPAELQAYPRQASLCHDVNSQNDASLSHWREPSKGLLKPKVGELKRSLRARSLQRSDDLACHRSAAGILTGTFTHSPSFEDACPHTTEDWALSSAVDQQSRTGQPAPRLTHAAQLVAGQAVASHCPPVHQADGLVNNRNIYMSTQADMLEGEQAGTKRIRQDYNNL